MSGNKFAAFMVGVGVVMFVWGMVLLQTVGCAARQVASVVAAALTPEAVPAVGGIRPLSIEAQAAKVIPAIIGKPDMETLARRVSRVTVLKQVAQEQEERLAQEQDTFCRKYGLDVGKLRAGRYSFDLKSGKVVER